MNNLSDLKKQQINSHNDSFKEISTVYELSNPVIRYISDKPLKTAINLLNQPLTNRNILCICAGSGTEAIFLQSLGAQVTATDISQEACKLIKKRNPYIKTEVQDAENLKYPDNSFDYVVVKHGLHHLPRPILGLYEMIRVAKKGIIVIEAQDTFFMNLLIKIHLAEKTEGAGNYVYRFKRREIDKLLNSMFISKYQIHTEWYQFSPFLNKWVYPHLNSQFGLEIFKICLNIFNLFFGYWGNNFILIIEK